MILMEKPISKFLNRSLLTF